MATVWPEMWPTTEAKGKVVVRALKELKAHFGRPCWLKTDNGTYFKNAGVKQWCKKGKVEHRFGIPYHQQGKVEHLNQEIKRKLQIAQEVFGKGWVRQIPWVLRVLRTWGGGNGEPVLLPR